MAKFKVGDKVRVKRNGNIGTISRADEWRTYPYKLKDDPNGEPFDGDEIEHVELRREFIVLRRDGAKTIAELRHDREIMKSAVATCSEKDTFDFETGAKIAFDRLMGRQNIEEAVKAWNEPAPAPEPPKFYTGKVFACDSQDAMFRKRDGYIFEFSNGHCVNARPGQSIPTCHVFKDILDIRKKMSLTTWHEVKSNV
jgi:hypothetical protein